MFRVFVIKSDLLYEVRITIRNGENDVVMERAW